MFLPGISGAPLEGSQYRQVLAKLVEAAVPLPEILHLLNARPEAARHFGRLMHAVLRGPSDIDTSVREMLAAFVAKTRNSFPLLAKHGATAGELSGDLQLVADVLDRYDTAPIPAREKALFACAERVSRDQPVVQEDVDRVLAAQWSEEAVLDAILICALVQFGAVLISAAGVTEVPPETLRVWARFLAEQGYALD